MGAAVSGRHPPHFSTGVYTTDGSYHRVWFREVVGAEEVAFEPDVFLLTKARAQDLSGSGTSSKGSTEGAEGPDFALQTQHAPKAGADAEPKEESEQTRQVVTLRLDGRIPSEAWNRFGQKVVTKLRASGDLNAEVSLTLSVPQDAALALEADLKEALTDLGIADEVTIVRR